MDTLTVQKALQCFDKATGELGSDKTFWVGCVDGEGSGRKFFSGDQRDNFAKAMSGEAFSCGSTQHQFTKPNMIVVFGEDRNRPVFDYKS